MSGRRSKTGLEWLMEERSKRAENGSAAAEPSPESVPDDPPPPQGEDEIPIPADTQVSESPTVAAPSPANILALDVKRPADRPRRGGAEDALPKRGADAVANTLLIAEKAAEAARKATDEAADEVADSLLKERADEEPGAAADASNLSAAIAAAQAAVRAAAKATDDATDHVADDILESKGRSAPEGEPETREIPKDESPAMAEHRKAVASGRSTRTYPRAVVDFEVRFKKGAEALVGKGRNVSVAGFFVETSKQLPEGEVFQAQLFFNGRKLSVIAEAMWLTSGDPENVERFPPGMGCKFLDVDDKDLPFLKALVDIALAGKK